MLNLLQFFRISSHDLHQLTNKDKMKHTTWMHKGYSLVELSAVMSIIGFLAVAITIGSSLIHKAKILAVINEAITLKTSIALFEEKYSYLPGDLPNATTLWPTANAHNGNGNGQIESYTTAESCQEPLYAWQDLSLAGLLAGTYTGADNGAPNDFMPNINVPATKIYNLGFYYFTSITGALYNRMGTYIQLGSGYGNPMIPWGPAMTPIDGYAIDYKMDDGNPSSGLVYAVRGGALGNGYCATNNWDTASSATYILTDTSISCRLYFWLNQIDSGTSSTF